MALLLSGSLTSPATEIEPRGRVRATNRRSPELTARGFCLERVTRIELVL